MRTAAALDDFLRAPRGACFEGQHFGFWNLGTVSGWRVWGAPQAEDGRQLVACIDTLYAPKGPRYFSLVDLRGLEAVGELGFEVLRSYVARRRGSMARRLVRQAVLKPQGLVGAMVAGFYVQLQPRHPVRVFEELTAATRWLAPDDGRALRALVAALEVPPAQRDGAVPALRRWLGEHPHRPSPAEAARALSLSTRTLQRRLREHRTSFSAQLRQVRVELAQRLLRDTEWKLAAVAQEVGFDSSQRLATAFREQALLTPSAFRAQFRAELGAEPRRR